MLKQTLLHFYEMADDARRKHGDSAPKVTDAIIEDAFPDTFGASLTEGCDRMFREGVMNAVKKYIRKPPASDLQMSLADIDSDFMPIVERLNSNSYYVPEGNNEGCYWSVVELCSDAKALDAARKHLRQKGLETLEEARKLDELYAAVTATA